MSPILSFHPPARESVTSRSNIGEAQVIESARAALQTAEAAMNEYLDHVREQWLLEKGPTGVAAGPFRLIG